MIARNRQSHRVHDISQRVRTIVGLLTAAAAWGWQQPPLVREVTHSSQVLNAERRYRAILPPAYETSARRYPVVYWFHGYDTGNNEREREIEGYVATHDLVVVEAGPVETTGEFPLYFPELAEHVDRTFRTLADRDHRGVTGFGMGGLFAFWMAGKFPDLVSSASAFDAPPETSLGPTGIETEFDLEDGTMNYDGVRTRQVTGPGDALAFYHRRLDALWLFGRTGHESASFDLAHATAAIPETLDFHLSAFRNPLPKPAQFSHADLYPNFAVWGWEVGSDRRQPGFTILRNVGIKGFRSSVREWVPGGATIPNVKVSIASARLYGAGSSHAVTYLHLKDGKLRRAIQRADAQGRLNFELDGDDWEVGIGAGAVITAADAEVDGSAWATAGSPVKLRVKFWNKGAARSVTSAVAWEAGAGVKVDPASSRLFGLAPGESALLPVTVTVAGPARDAVRLVAVAGGVRFPIEVPLFPPAETAEVFQIADGKTAHVWQHATRQEDVPFGQGNGDGHAAPGESFAVLIPDGEWLRAAELFTNDPCVDLSLRADDSWDSYDHSGASARYTIAAVRPDCAPGHVIRMLGRVLMPSHEYRYYNIETPVWWREGEKR